MKLKFVENSCFYSTFESLGAEEKESAREFVETVYDFGDFEVMYSYCAGCIILRYYSEDAGYHFDAPFPISNDADERAAFEAISEYCRLEAIPETVVGILPELLDDMLRGAENYSLGEDDDGTFAVKIITECMSCEFMPEIMVDDVYLGEFADKYASKYEDLIKNANLNCHFGYNLLEDMPFGDGMDFVNNAREEFERSESMTFAVTLEENGENIFVGEGTLYAFDGRGSALMAFRVLPDYHGRGIGRKTLIGLMRIAKELGLKNVVAEVKNENVPSVNLLSKFAKGKKKTEKTVFVLTPSDF